ncbi:PREDICTED: BPI fold-containing family B member 1 [Condylura cristata]|uniref:BPI fold-containing family B member 1 n=1 Tax=Condylura cristata TaxID=143302 RepID=UPI000642F3AD|nr:PREDICTED: BPI fold-containing family B member 1 [Condylura cristata]
MSVPWTLTLLSTLLAAPLAGATMNPPAVLSLSSEVIQERLMQKLRDHEASNVLQQLPLLSAIQKKPAGVMPTFNNMVNFVLKYIVWIKVTSANILQLQVQPSVNNQELVVKIPLDMTASFNTPLVKTLVQLRMESEVQITIRVENWGKARSHLVLRDCFNMQDSLHIGVLQKISFLIRTLADKVINLLTPVLPRLVNEHLCPVINEAFEDMQNDLLGLVKAPVAVMSNHLEFDLLSPAIKGNSVQLNMKAKMLDSQGKVTKQFNESAPSMTMPAVNNARVSLTVRQDLLNAAVAVLIPPEEVMVLFDYMFPELALWLKSSIKLINEKAANQLEHTQVVKVYSHKTPELILNQGRATVAQLIMLEVYATNQIRRPFFTLGIEASSDAHFSMEGDQVILKVNNIRCDRIHLLNSGLGLFNPELLKDITTEILVTVLLPHENGKLKAGVPVSMVKALGLKEMTCFLTKDALVVTSVSS